MSILNRLLESRRRDRIRTAERRVVGPKRSDLDEKSGASKNRTCNLSIISQPGLDSGETVTDDCAVQSRRRLPANTSASPRPRDRRAIKRSIEYPRKELVITCDPVRVRTHP